MTTTCLDCGDEIPGGSRCPRHRRAAERRHHNQAYDTVAYRRARAAAIAAHVSRHGWVCLGEVGHPPHETRHLTADHPIRLVDGGRIVQRFDVVCRSLNSSRGARRAVPA
jgi:hypothetical protein